MRRTRTNPPQAPHVRRGVFLVELIIAITIGGLVLAMGIGMLHLLLRTDKTLADSLWRSQTVSQLSRTFRGDAHAARDVEVEQPEDLPNANEPAPPVVRIDLAPDHHARYSIENHAVLRTETKADKTLQTERFRFQPGTKISIETDDSRRLSLVIRSANPELMKPTHAQKAVPLRELRITAVRGRNHRFEAAPEKPEPEAN